MDLAWVTQSPSINIPLTRTHIAREAGKCSLAVCVGYKGNTRWTVTSFRSTRAWADQTGIPGLPESPPWAWVLQGV